MRLRSAIKKFFIGVYTATRLVWSMAGLVLVAVLLLFGRNLFTFYTAMPQVSYEGQSAAYKRDVAQRGEWHIKVPSDFNYRKHRFYEECSGGENCPGPQTKRRMSHGPSTLEVFGHADNNDRFVFSHRGPTRMKLELSSDVGQPRESAGEMCVAGAAWMPACEAAAEDCKVFMTYEGWPVFAAVARAGLYREPERVCRIVRETLRSWTFDIDARGPAWQGQ